MLPFSYGRVFRNRSFTSSITIHHVIITLRHAIGRELISSSARGGTQEVKEEDLIDPYCVEDNPQTIPFKNVTSAAFKIKYDIVNTPCVVRSLSHFSPSHLTRLSKYSIKFNENIPGLIFRYFTRKKKKTEVSFPRDKLDNKRGEFF